VILILVALAILAQTVRLKLLNADC